MKRMRSSRLVSLILMFVVAAGSLAGCGAAEKSDSSAPAKIDSETIYREITSPLDDIIKSADAGRDENEDETDAESLNFISTTAENGRYYVLYTDPGSGDSAFLCSFDAEGENGVKVQIPGSEESSVSLFSVLPDGSIVLLTSEEDEEKGVSVWQMRRLLAEGKDEPKLKEVWKKSISEEEDFYPGGIVSTETEIYLKTEKDVRIYDSNDGGEKKKAELPSEFYGNICKSPGGDILLSGDGSDGVVAYTLDRDTGKFTETRYKSAGFFFVETVVSGSGDYDFYLTKRDGIYAFRLDGSDPVRVMDFLASDLEIDSTAGCSILPGDTLVLLYHNLDYDTTASLFKKSDDGGEGGKTVLSLACTYADTSLSKAVVHFNKSNDRYRIVLVEYPYDDEGNNTLNMEIAAGNIPDMICTSADMPVKSYASKGLFEDLGPLFSEDEEVSGNEYLDNVLDAFRIDGKMYFVTPFFNVMGLFGKKKDFGDTRGVTTAQIEKMMQERNLGYDTAMGAMTRDGMLSWVMYCAMEEYVDWDAGTCSFGSESFVNLLKFCSEFPETINYENIDWTKYETAMREGRQLVRDGYLYGFEGYMQERYGYIGEEVTFMGYPGSGSNGPVIMDGLAIAISKGSTDVRGCWEFLREFYLDDYQESINESFPVSKKALQKLADKALNPRVHTYIDENEKEVSEPETTSVYLNDQEIRLPVPTQEDIDTVMNIINSLDMMAGIDSKITEIINEESGAFFAGQKSAETTADIIQSRVTVYINESR